MRTERCSRISRLCVVVLVAHLGTTLSAGAIDLGVRWTAHRHAGILSACRSIWKCGQFGCAWHKICPRACPGRIGCSSLYGAYGPDGGHGFWSAFTASSFVGYR